MKQELKAERWVKRKGGISKQNRNKTGKNGRGWSVGFFLISGSLQGDRERCVCVRWQGWSNFAMVKCQEGKRKPKKSNNNLGNWIWQSTSPEGWILFYLLLIHHADSVLYKNWNWDVVDYWLLGRILTEHTQQRGIVETTRRE